MRRALAAAAALGPLLAACGDGSEAGPGPVRDTVGAPADPAPWFEEVAAERGLDFVHRSGHDGTYLFPEIMGGGAGLFDADGDEDLDVYLVQSGDLRRPGDADGANRLYFNEGAGTFRDAGEGSGAGDRGYGMGCAVGDVDADGDLDLYVTNVGPNALLLNDGSGRFRDDTARAAVGHPGWGVGAAFFDGDLDGALDLFVVNYVQWSQADELACDQPPGGADYCSPRSYAAPAPDVLFTNQGAGRFRDASVEAGLRSAFGNGLGVLSGDFDDDGWPDVFVANDGDLNQLWVNQHDGTFVDGAMRAGCAADEDGSAKAGMGVAACDLDGDGDEDLLVVNLDRQSDSFYRNEGSYFSDRTARMGLSATSRSYTRFGCGFADFDRDGHEDLYLATGRVARGLEAGSVDPYAEENLLLAGGPEGFTEVLPRGGTARPFVETSRAAAFGDLDGDGALDVLVVNRDGPVRFFRNVVAAPGKWVSLAIRLPSGAPALGAVVSGHVGQRLVRRTVRSASSYLAASDARVHVGLGSSERLTGVRVRWPGGAEEAFGDLAAGAVHRLVRGAGD